VNRHAIVARVESIHSELSSGNVSAARLKELSAEPDQLEIAFRTHSKATSMASYASPAEHGYNDAAPGDFDNGASGYGTGGVGWKSFGLPAAPQVAPPTLDISEEQIKSLFDAAKAGAPYKVTLGTKDFASSLRDKVAGVAPSRVGSHQPAASDSAARRPRPPRQTLRTIPFAGQHPNRCHDRTIGGISAAHEQDKRGHESC
jgi:hypothetical protein